MLPTPVFPGGIDPPIQQDSNFKQDKAYVSYVGGQIRTLQQFGIGVSFVTVTASFTMAASALASPTIIFTGSVAAAFIATVPTAFGFAFARQVVNETAFTVTLTPSTGGVSVSIPALSQ